MLIRLLLGLTGPSIVTGGGAQWVGDPERQSHTHTYIQAYTPIHYLECASSFGCVAGRRRQAEREVYEGLTFWSHANDNGGSVSSEQPNEQKVEVEDRERVKG